MPRRIEVRSGRSLEASLVAAVIIGLAISVAAFAAFQVYSSLRASVASFENAMEAR